MAAQIFSAFLSFFFASGDGLALLVFAVISLHLLHEQRDVFCAVHLRKSWTLRRKIQKEVAETADRQEGLEGPSGFKVGLEKAAPMSRSVNGGEARRRILERLERTRLSQPLPSSMVLPSSWKCW